MAQNSNDKQSKGEKQLSDLIEFINFMLERFNEFEKERKEKEKVIEDLQEKLYVLSNKVEKMENSIDKQG